MQGAVGALAEVGGRRYAGSEVRKKFLMRRYAAFHQTIEVEVRAFPATGWLLAGFEVRVDGQVFHPRLDRAGFFTHPLTEFYVVGDDGRMVPGMVRGIGHWFFLRKKRYSLVVGMSELARDTQRVRGWLPACFVALALGMVLVLAALGAFVAGWWWWNFYHGAF